MKQSFPVGSYILLAVSLAILTSTVSDNYGSRFVHQQETVYEQHAILAGQPFLRDGEARVIPQFYNRILFPAVFSLVSRLHILGDTQSYLLCRFLNCILLFVTFLWVSRRALNADIRISMVGAGLLAYTYIFTFNHGWAITSDYFDGIFMCLFLLLSLERRRWGLFLVSILAGFNRESAAFAGVLWFVLYGVSRNLRIQWREAFYAGVLSVSSYATAILVRLAILGRARTFASDGQVMVTPREWWREFSAFLHHPTPSSWPILAVAMLIPSLWWAWMNREYVSEMPARLLMAAGLLGAATCFWGLMQELRIFIPGLVVLVFTCVWLEVLRGKRLVSVHPQPSAVQVAS
jgi:hypothetical protein